MESEVKYECTTRNEDSAIGTSYNSSTESEKVNSGTENSGYNTYKQSSDYTSDEDYRKITIKKKTKIRYKYLNLKEEYENQIKENEHIKTQWIQVKSNNQIKENNIKQQNRIITDVINLILTSDERKNIPNPDVDPFGQLVNNIQLLLETFKQKLEQIENLDHEKEKELKESKDHAEVLAKLLQKSDQQISSANKNLEYYKLELKKINGTLITKDAEIDEVQINLKRSNEKYEKLKKEKDVTDVSNSVWERKCQQANDEIKIKTDEYEKLKKEKDVTDMSNSVWERKFKQANDEIKIKRDEIKTLKINNNERSSRKQKYIWHLKREHRENTTNLQQKIRYNNNMYKKDVTKLRHKIMENNRTYTNNEYCMKNEYMYLKNMYEKLYQKYKDLEEMTENMVIELPFDIKKKAENDHESKNKSLESEIINLNNEIKQLKKKITELQKLKANSIDHSVKQLKRNCEQYKQNIEKLDKELVKNIEDNNTLKKIMEKENNAKEQITMRCKQYMEQVQILENDREIYIENLSVQTQETDKQKREQEKQKQIIEKLESWALKANEDLNMVYDHLVKLSKDYSTFQLEENDIMNFSQMMMDLKIKYDHQLEYSEQQIESDLKHKHLPPENTMDEELMNDMLMEKPESDDENSENDSDDSEQNEMVKLFQENSISGHTEVKDDVEDLNAEINNYFRKKIKGEVIELDTYTIELYENFMMSKEFKGLFDDKKKRIKR